jgi:acetylglutamate kinase
MKYVIKLGGAGLENPTLLQGCVRAIANLVQDGNQVAVVHGGGIQLTKTLAQLGKKSEFINGLRVTDAETRDVALMVLACGCVGFRRSAGVWSIRRRWVDVSRAQEADRT